MSEKIQRSAGVRTREIDLSGPTALAPQGVPAAIIGTAKKGRAFVPILFATIQDFEAEFGRSDGEKFGPLAVYEWMRDGNARSGIYVRTLGVGSGLERTGQGTVTKAGFVVGSDQTQLKTKMVGGNSHTNVLAAGDGDDAVEGRTYFLGAYMTASAGSKIFVDAGMHTEGGVAHGVSCAEPILRGVLMIPSGVIPTLSSSYRTHDQGHNTIALDQKTKLLNFNANLPSRAKINGMKGSGFGDYVNSSFVLFLNGHKGSSAYPNQIKASFDPSSENHITKKLNMDPYKIEKAGHLLYTYYDVETTQADVLPYATAHGDRAVNINGGGTHSSRIRDAGDTCDQTAVNDDSLRCFILSGAYGPNVFDAKKRVPNYENFEERYSTAKSPFVISQKFGASPKNLFRFHALDDGVPGTKVKITIESIQASDAASTGYGTFDILIRDFYDTDLRRVVLESYRGCNLDPSSDNFVARKIGDFHMFYDFDRRPGSQRLRNEGLFQNKSSYVRIEMHPDVLDATRSEKTALPMGFRGAPHLLTGVRVNGDNATKGYQRLLSVVGGDVHETDSNIAGGGDGAAAGKEARAPDVDPTTAVQNAEIRSKGLARMIELPTPMREHVHIRDKAKASLTWGVQFEKKTSASQPNLGKTVSSLLENQVKFFPMHSDRNPAPQVFDNEGTPDSLGVVLDCDKFNNNMFTLERVQVVTGSTDKPDPGHWATARYRRNGALAKLVDADANEHSANHTRFIDPSKDFSHPPSKPYLKFTFPLYGGFDGNNIFNKDKHQMSDHAVRMEMDDPNLKGNAENVTASIKKAIDVLTEKSDSDIQLMAIPGMRNPAITDHAIDAVTERFDAMLVMDVEEMDLDGNVVTGSNLTTEGQLVSVENTVTRLKARNLDTSFAAAYFPDVVIEDKTTRTNVACPPSVAVIGAMSLNDRLGHPWFAPAGFARGALKSVINTSVDLNQANLDLLYGSDINPITSFPQNPEAGNVIFGQKTLQAAASPLDRVNVRRLLIDLRRKVRNVALTFLFEPNREETLSKFAAQVTPILANIQAQRGVSRFKVQIDTTTTTQADVENNTIRGKIYLQPVRSLEFVELDFVVTNQGAEI